MPDKYKGVKFERLVEGKIVVGVHPHSPLALNSILTPAQLVGQTLVLYDDSYIKDYVERYLSGYGPINLLFVVTTHGRLRMQLQKDWPSQLVWIIRF